MRNERSHHEREGRKEGGKEGRGTKNNVTHNGLCQISTKEREGRGRQTREMKAAHPLPCRDRELYSTGWCGTGDSSRIFLSESQSNEFGTRNVYKSNKCKVNGDFVIAYGRPVTVIFPSFIIRCRRILNHMFEELYVATSGREHRLEAAKH